ncbi:Uncharacterized protein Adt_23718 [Abeliophyllum distichum]|uniref:Uncharacterized protein n=1 Tax=Abeliophyllum distichum TaxID=126358 RepID=A0ABD1SBN0_9LAMI
MVRSQSLNSQRSEYNKAHPEIMRDLKVLNVRPDDERTKLSRDLDDDNKNLSFSKELKTRELSTRFKMPHMEKYNSICDPTYHNNVYKTRLQGYILPIKCKNFHTILVSGLKRWFNKLKPGNIRSLPQLKQEFINAFIGNRTMIADMTQLYDI